MAEQPKKTKKQFSKYTYYETSSDKVTRKKQSCPRCGPGVFLAEHKDRKACGKCAYSETAGRKPAEEAPKTEKEAPKEETPTNPSLNKT